MKIKLLLFVSLLFVSFTFAQNINFTDPNFKNLLLSSRGYYVSECSATDINGNYLQIDANNDGQIHVSEAQKVYSLHIFTHSTTPILSSFTGIEFFTNLRKLSISSGNHDTASELNIITLSNLEWLGIYSVRNLTKLDVSNAANLKDLTVRETAINDFNMGTISNIERMEFTSNKITSLDLSRHNNLVTLNCKANPIATLVLPTAKNIVDLDCSATEITELNLAGFTKLKNLYCQKGSSGYPSYFTAINKISSFDISGCLNLEKLSCSQNAITTLNLENYTKLTYLDCEQNKLSLLNLNGCSNLETLYMNTQNVVDFDLPSFGAELVFTINGCVKLKNLELNYVPVKILNAEGCTALENVNGYNSLIENANFRNCTNLLGLNIYNTQLATLNIEGCTKLDNISCNNNKLVTLNASGATALTSVSVNDNLLENLNFTGCTNLTTVSASHNKLQNLALENLPTLNSLSLDYNLLTSLILSNLSNLESIGLSHNQLTVLPQLSNVPSLHGLSLDYNLLSSLNFSNINNLSNLTYLNLDHNQLPAFQLANLPLLKKLILSNNLLTSLSFPAVTVITDLDVSNNLLTALNVENLPELVNFKDVSIYDFDTEIFTDGNVYTSLDFTKNAQLTVINVVSRLLKTLFIKNNATEYIEGFTPNLEYVCCDENQITDIQQSTGYLGAVNVSVNSYCTFVPGGNFNTISGKVRFDENNNGCDASDGIFEHLKIKINDGTTSGETFTDKDGNYKFYTKAGDFTITSESENAALFNISPASFTTTFADANNNLLTQNICVTPVGNSPDLEVVIAPLVISRPGFNATYKLIVRNKGNKTLNGTADFNFENAKMSYVSSSVTANSATTNQLVYQFSNLKPFENRAVEIKFLINKPTDTVPVNVGDYLNFSANINPVSGDILPNDNHFAYKETVVGAIDPNDIVCMEGNIVPREKIGDYLHYTVNFENTGTYAAENIVVTLDVNPNDYEISTLQLQNSSANTYTKIQGQKVEFMMENIQLPIAAHGNIQLKMKTKGTKNPGDHVKLNANIYFDYNLPIATNDAVTVFEQTLASNSVNLKSKIQVYPNPSFGPITIKSTEEINSVSLYDRSGRLLQTQIGSGKEKILDISRYPAGIYYLTAKTKNGESVEKLIKK